MSLERMICNRLRNAPPLQEALATFNGHAAAFYEKAPDKASNGWAAEQYPRIDFVVDMQENPAMGTSGVLSLNIWVDAAGSVEPESIELIVRVLFDSTLVQPEDQPVYSIAWYRSDSFEQEKDAQQYPDRRIIGYTMTFTITALPGQRLFEPDPVLAINEWAKAKHPNALIIGMDDIAPEADGGWYVPTQVQPAIHWRISALEIDHYAPGFTCVWLKGLITGHVFGAHALERMPMVFALMNELSMKRHIRMEDGSPMRIIGIKGDANQSYLPQGQLAVQILYGALPQYMDTEKFVYANNTFHSGKE